MRKVSRFKRFKQRVMGNKDLVSRAVAEQHIEMSESVLDELMSRGFSKPVPFLIVELECPPEKLRKREWARVDLSTGPVWVFPYHDRKKFLAYLDDTSEDFINKAVAQGADLILAVFRHDKFALVPANIKPHALKAVYGAT